MRVAFLTPEFARKEAPDGGLANYLYKITGLLRDRGHEPLVFLMGKENRGYVLEGVPVREIAPCRLPAAFFRGPLRPYRILCVDWLTRRRLAKVVLAEHARRPIDLAQASSYAFPGLCLAGKAPFPLVVRVSSYSPLVRAAFGRVKSFPDHLQDWLEFRQIQKADAVFAPSMFLQKHLARLENLSVQLVRTPFHLPGMAEEDGLYRSQFEGKRYLHFFGTLSRIKGVDLLAEALPSVLASFPDLHAVFSGRDDGLVGGCACERRLRESSGVFAERLRFTGPLPRQVLYPIIRGACVVVLPSRMDNYPNTCLEAQGLGKIVVGTSDSSLEEMIEDGATGFLAENGNALSLRDALLRALSLSPEQRRLMESNVANLLSVRDPERDVNQLLELYQKTLDRFRSDGGRPPR